MKFKKSSRLVIITLAIALLLGTLFAVGAMAEDTALEPVIVSKNLKYGDRITLCFAVPTSTASASATLDVWTGDPAVEGSEYKGSVSVAETLTTDVITGASDTYYVFEVTGIKASDTADEVYVQVVSDGVKSEVVKYSVAEYFYERLFTNGILFATEGKDLLRKELYLSYLEYAADAQELFVNFDAAEGEGETVVTDLAYLTVADGTVLGSASGIFEKDATVTFTANEGVTVPCWNATVYTVSPDGSYTTVDEVVLPGAEYTVKGHTVLTVGEISAGSYFSAYGGLVYDDRSTARSLAVDGLVYGCDSGNAGKHSLAGYMLYDQTSFATTSNRAYMNLVTDPVTATGKVLRFHKYDIKASTRAVFTSQNGAEEGNCLVFETRFLLSDVIDGITSYVGQTTPWILEFALVNTSSKVDDNYGTVYYHEGTAGFAYISVIADETSESGYRYCISDYNMPNTLSLGGEIFTDEWTTVTFEVYSNGTTKFFVNGNYVTSKTTNTAGYTFGSNGYDSVALRARDQMTNGFGAYFDNTFVGIFDKEYVAE